MKTFNLKAEVILWLLLIVPAIYLGFVWSQLPDNVPIHFDINGEPNGWASKPAEFILIGINVFVYVLTLFINRIDPKNLGEGFFNSNFFKIRAAIIVFMSALSVMVIYVGLPGHANTAISWMPALIFALIAVMGNFMINVKPNWFIGIRTPWTLSNDIVWKKTHQFGGRLWFYGGIIYLLSIFFFKGVVLNALLVSFILGSAVLMFGYSYWVFRQEENKTV